MAATFMLVVGRDVAVGLVKANAVVRPPHPRQLDLEHDGAGDVLEVGPQSLLLPRRVGALYRQ